MRILVASVVVACLVMASWAVGYGMGHSAPRHLLIEFECTCGHQPAPRAEPVKPDPDLRGDETIL